ncbi:MAG: hypothetical protein RMJ55_19750, partial [Roseiflexaceae bacterium]|nr:hypothetical protein [Roseiflexaceae bacterium]
YGIWPLPGSPTNLRIQYAVLTELVETGLYDLDGDGRDDSVLDRRTDVLDGTFTVTLVARGVGRCGARRVLCGMRMPM